jgi:hypothetical protein
MINDLRRAQCASNNKSKNGRQRNRGAGRYLERTLAKAQRCQWIVIVTAPRRSTLVVMNIVVVESQVERESGGARQTSLPGVDPSHPPCLGRAA